MAINQVVNGREVSSEQLTKILDILHMAFERPSVVKNAGNRKPTAALVLLRRLEDEPFSAEQLKAIGSTTQETSLTLIDKQDNSSPFLMTRSQLHEPSRSTASEECRNAQRI